MTILRVTLAGTSLSGEARSQLAQRLIEAFAQVEVGRSAPQIRAGFVVHIEEIDPANVWQGDAPMVAAGSSGRAALLDARVMAGPWNAEMKAELFARLEEIVRDVADMPRSGNGADVWMTFVEVPEGSWGLGGQPVSIEKLAPVFQDDRRERIDAYLAKRD